MMPGEITALLAAVCYGVGNMLLRRGQRDTLPADNGLFPILMISGIILTYNMFLDLLDDPAPLVIGEHWLPSILFCILAGVAATLFGRLALYAAIVRIGATRGSIIIAMAPMVTVMIAFTFLGERLGFFDLVGAFLLMGGVGLLMLEKSRLEKSRLGKKGHVKPQVEKSGAEERDRRTFLKRGFVIAALATFFQGTGYSFRKMGATIPIDPIFAGAIDTLAALVVYVMILGYQGRLKQYFVYYTRNLNIYVCTAGFVMAAAVFLFFDAVSSIPVSTVSVIIGSQPVIVAVLSAIFLKELEQLTWMTGVSAVFVSLGVVFFGLH